MIASARGSSASVSAPVAISVRNRSRSSPQRRASGSSSSPAARTSVTVASRSPRAVAMERTAAVTRPATSPPSVRRTSRTTSATPGRRASRSCERFWYGSPARVSAWASGPACASVRYSTAMSARPSLPCSCPSARPLSRLWKDAPPSSLSTVAAIQAASACSSAASSRVTTPRGHQGSAPGPAKAVRPGISVAGAMACMAAVTMAGLER